MCDEKNVGNLRLGSPLITQALLPTAGFESNMYPIDLKHISFDKFGDNAAWKVGDGMSAGMLRCTDIAGPTFLNLWLWSILTPSLLSLSVALTLARNAVYVHGRNASSRKPQSSRQRQNSNIAESSTKITVALRGR